MALWGLLTALLCALLWGPGTASAAPGSQLVRGVLRSSHVPGSIEYSVLLPPGYSDRGARLPLVLSLHGAGGDREVLDLLRPRFEKAWERGELPPMVVATPTVTQSSQYLDFADGSQKWETFLLTDFLPHLQRTFHVRTDRRGTLITGLSMGGTAALRLAFKHPDTFGAVAALEPATEPILQWSSMEDKHRFGRPDALWHRLYGEPVDADYWQANHPAAIAADRSATLRASGLKVYIEAGDQDMFWLYEGAEYLHRVLWARKIRHEYRLYYGVDHVGASIGPRTADAFRFLAATLTDPAPDEQVDTVRAKVDPLKRSLTEADHYGIDRHLIAPEEEPGPGGVEEASTRSEVAPPAVR